MSTPIRVSRIPDELHTAITNITDEHVHLEYWADQLIVVIPDTLTMTYLVLLALTGLALLAVVALPCVG
jgi:hypothetical protein